MSKRVIPMELPDVTGSGKSKIAASKLQYAYLCKQDDNTISKVIPMFSRSSYPK